MTKRKNRSKRSLGSLPKGLPVRGGKEARNPFESAGRHAKRPKHEVVNRRTGNAKVVAQSALARAVAARKDQLKSQLQAARKSNSFVDKRIGEYDTSMTAEEQNLARIVKERARRSKRRSKFALDDQEDEEGDAVLTHRGKAIDSLTARDHVMLSDDEQDDNGQLDALDTLQHFGGGSNSAAPLNPYGPAGGNSGDLSSTYATRKLELDDLILRRKILKVERMKSKEAQVDTFEKMDDSFADLAKLLSFRDKEKEIKDYHSAKREGRLSGADQEMAEWDKEMKNYQFAERKVKALDRTKTPEEIAKNEAERLHELETRRMARMNGDFSKDDFSDIDEAELQGRGGSHPNPDELDDDSESDDNDDQLKTRFTADGLVKVDKDGNIVERVGQKEQKVASHTVLAVGTRVSASYHAKEQLGGEETWFDAVVAAVNRAKDGSVTYNVDYADGDFEDKVEPHHIKAIGKTEEELQQEEEKTATDVLESRKRLKAKEKARSELPFVFEVPTTLEALHDMIATYASTGKDASTIIHRIHACNSVRLNRKNTEKMQNFYDVVLRRFIAVGDAIHRSGDGGPELGRFDQLNELTKLLYTMAQESPESAGAVWARRLGILHNAHAKRLRDAELQTEEEHETAWPSIGVVLILRALGHVFPVTDKRHYVVTPAMLLLGQMIAHTPVLSTYDLVMGVLCSGLLIEYSREAKRFAPESISFISGVIRLFAVEGSERSSEKVIPTVSDTANRDFAKQLREKAANADDNTALRISFEEREISGDSTPAAILFAVLSLSESAATSLSGAMDSAEREALHELTESLLCLKPTHKKFPLGKVLRDKVASAAKAVADACQYDSTRSPLTRRSGAKLSVIKTLAPKMEDPEKYKESRDKGKSATQADLDRTRRELKRERKAVSRELRLDAAFVEAERREERDRKDSAARAQRNKAFSWLEMEQASMNQQVREGGGLLSGGGMGAARAKAKSGKVGIKKGGKF